MPTVTAWPGADRAWVARHRMSMTSRHVPALVLEERERALLNVVLEVEVAAAEIFGDADELAVEDAAVLATSDEAVRTSLGGGLRPALREVGGTLVGSVSSVRCTSPSVTAGPSTSTPHTSSSR